MQKQIDSLGNDGGYKPSKADKLLVRRIYDEFTSMRDVQQKPYKYFNNRSLIEFIDDSEKRFNGYVPTKAAQGKEEWQANFFHPVTRNKTMAILAAVALNIPPIKITAINEKNERNMKIANIMGDLNKASYANDDVEEDNFFEVLEAAVKGTVISYDGYLKTRVKRKQITSFDVVIGEVEYEEKDVVIDKGCQSFTLPLENFFVYDAYIRKLQDQPAVCWVQYMNQRDFAWEFSNYANFKYVKEGSELTNKDVRERYFYDDWYLRTKERPIEVVRYYNKVNDEYIIVANGVKLLEAPLLLGNQEKYYPFSKGGYAPFSGDFFWMNSLPNTLMGEQDVLNAFYNMVVDKGYRSLVNSLLIGNTNKDDFDLEDEEITLDTKIYVQDISQVKEMPNSGPTNADFNLIKLISQGLDLSAGSDSAQQGVQGKGVTAREVVIANENARKLKGIFFLFITSLWLQKTSLRISTILAHYTGKQIANAVGDEKAETYKRFIVENVELANGKQGNRGILITPNKDSLPPQDQLDKNVEEYKKINPGAEYEEIAVTAKYLQNWQYKTKVIAEDLYAREGSFAISKIEDKLRLLMKAFPQYFKKNEEKLVKDTITALGDDVDEYDLVTNPPEEVEEEIEGAEELKETPPNELM